MTGPEWRRIRAGLPAQRPAQRSVFERQAWRVAAWLALFAGLGALIGAAF